MIQTNYMHYHFQLCTKKHLAEILEILNNTIMYSTALYEYKPRTVKDIESAYTMFLK
jgi:L-amino acid N-acyltransferase YncA